MNRRESYGIVRVPEYEAEFEAEEFEIYGITASDANGASPYLDKYHRPLVSTDAILDTRTGVLDHEGRFDVDC